jgi:hypothetical protein
MAHTTQATKVQASQTADRRVDPQFIYKTIREEVIDQKRCQFQLLSLSVTLTAGVLAPLVMNAVAIVIILDKAVSVQRKVGYLQMMEENFADYTWMWEKQLDEFRKLVPERAGVRGDPARKHSYVTMVGLMLIILNVICCFLFIAAPGAWQWHVENFPGLSLASSGIVLLLLLGGVIVFFVKRSQLLDGRHSGPQIRSTWEQVLRPWIISSH